ncbi:MAG: hypothetical protein ACXACR_16140, partial [Candidatus Hodarchaeales archaeon]|jgi:hypothetical protein
VAKSYQLTPGIHRYYFTYDFNQEIAFQFNFNELLMFELIVTDNGLPDFPEWLDSKRNSHTVGTGLFSLRANYDQYKPLFIKKDGSEMNVIYKNISTVDTSSDITNITDGAIVITVSVQDPLWAGLSSHSVRLIITDISTGITLRNETMVFMKALGDNRSEFQFKWEEILVVRETYQFNVTVTDNAGNTNSLTREVEIEDHVAPRVRDVQLIPTDDRKLNITIKFEEKGVISGVTVGIVYMGEIIKWVNLSRQQGGGVGGQTTPGLNTEIFSALAQLDLDVFDFISLKTYSIVLSVSDNAGNSKYYDSRELEETWVGKNIDESFNPLIFHPVFLLSSGIFLLIGIIVGIRITSKTVGYDLKQVMVESKKVSREVLLTMMDEYALGIIISFFDQVQGPVPVIWEPPLLEDQHQIMLDLSDKSFSTLEFVGLDEDERSSTFDFSTGSYDCTALGYSFAIENPQARGGKENLSIVLLLRKEWGDNLLTFQDVLLEKIREIRKLIEAQEPEAVIEKKGRDLREFVSRLMITFNKMYSGINYEVDSMVE